jgi:hypothetical protein
MLGSPNFHKINIPVYLLILLAKKENFHWVRSQTRFRTVFYRSKGEFKMSKAAKSLFVFGIYLIVIGLAFLLVPNMQLRLFGFPETSEPWIRVMAVLLLLLAFYYIQAARSEMTKFIRLTVPARASVIVFFIAFIAFGLAQPMLIMFGVVDLLAAIWTSSALRNP